MDVESLRQRLESAPPPAKVARPGTKKAMVRELSDILLRMLRDGYTVGQLVEILRKDDAGEGIEISDNTLRTYLAEIRREKAGKIRKKTTSSKKKIASEPKAETSSSDTSDSSSTADVVEPKTTDKKDFFTDRKPTSTDDCSFTMLDW